MKPAATLLWPYFVVVGLIGAGYGAVFTVLAEFRDRFGFSDVGVGLIAASGFFAGFIAQVSLSRFADRGHAVAMIRLGMLTVVGSMALMTVGTSLWAFVGARVILGVGAGMVVPAARRIVIASDPEHVGTNLGRLGASDIAGFTIGPMLAALLVTAFGLRAPFVVIGAVALACVPFFARVATDPGRVDEAHLPVRALLHNRSLLAVLALALGFYAMIGTFDATWAVLMTDHGAGTFVIGVTFTLFALPMIVLTPLGGRLAQRHGPMRIAMIGLLCATPCVLSYGFLGSVLALSLMAAVQSLADSLTFPATQVGVAMASPPDRLAAAQGMLGASELLAAGCMAVAAGMLYESVGAGAVYSATAAVMLGCVVVARILSRESALDPAAT